MKRLKLLLFVCFIYYSSILFSNHRFDRITAKNGRSLGFITGIEQDHNDFLWIATREGLYRYDGYFLKYYTRQFNDSNTVVLGDITYMHKDIEGNLWLRHYNQLQLFENEKISNHYSFITSKKYSFNTKIIDDKYFYWIGPTKDGLIQVNKSTREIKVFSNNNPKNKIVSSRYCDLVNDKESSICLLGTKGIERFNISKGIFEFYPIDFENIGYKGFDPDLMSLYPISPGKYFVCLSNGLLEVKLDERSNSKKTQLIPINTGMTILSVYRDSKNQVWIGSTEGLFILENHILKKIAANNDNQLYPGSAYVFFEDNLSNLWIGTFEGLNKLTKNYFYFQSLGTEQYGNEPVYYDQKSDLIWYVSYDQILHKKSLKTSVIEQYPLRKNVSNTNLNLLECNDINGDSNFIYLAMDYYLKVFSINSQKIVKAFQMPDIKCNDAQARNNILSIDIGSHSSIWLSTPVSIYKYDLKNNLISRELKFGVNPEYTYNIDNTYIQYTIKSSSEHVWFRTSNGLYLLDSKNETLKNIHRFSIENDHLNVIDGNLAIDGNNTLWMAAFPEIISIDTKTLKKQVFLAKGTGEMSNCNVFPDSGIIWIYTNNGLYKFDTQNDSTKAYSYNDGLADNHITGIRSDKNNNLWITTTKGLSCLNKQSMVFTNYFRPIDPISLIFRQQPRRVITQNQFLPLFAQSDIILYFPDSINNTPPNTLVTSFQVFGREYPLDSLIYRKKKIKLKYNENYLKFEFAALDFTSPEKNKYAYMLQGTDPGWIYTEHNNRLANYTALPPGKYIFHVKACNNDNIWSNSPTILEIEITPPWYKTTLAYLIYFLTFLLILISYIRFRERNLKKEKLFLEAKVFERTKTIREQNKEIIQQRDQIAGQNKNIQDSIRYAKRIQNALLPNELEFQRLFDEYFIFFRPRDIVSGDFYWIAQKDNKILVAAADCTGHGVPGAFMSMLGVALLSEIVSKLPELVASEILEFLKMQIILLLKQGETEFSTKDGMDISVVIIDYTHMELQFSGAYNPIFLIESNGLTELKPNRMPVGISEKNEKFRNISKNFKKGDLIYLFSDGYIDQFHYLTQEKFKTKRFLNLINQIKESTLEEQKIILEKNLSDWMGETDQVDDILIIGLKL